MLMRFDSRTKMRLTAWRIRFRHVLAKIDNMEFARSSIYIRKLCIYFLRIRLYCLVKPCLISEITERCKQGLMQRIFGQNELVLVFVTIAPFGMLNLTQSLGIRPAHVYHLNPNFFTTYNGTSVFLS